MCEQEVSEEERKATAEASTISAGNSYYLAK